MQSIVEFRASGRVILKQAGTDGGQGGEGGGTRRLTRDASLQGQSVRREVAPITPWVVRPLQCRSRYTDANATADD